MKSNTEAFERLRKEEQEIMNFTYLICTAIPNLKKSMKGYKEKIKNYESLAKPEHFIESRNHFSRLESLSKTYKRNLTKYVLISSYSFFESYFRSAIKELIEFHGGKEIFLKNTSHRMKELIKSYSLKVENNDSIADISKKLREPYKKKNTQRYKKALKELESKSNYRNPSELLSITFGLKNFLELVNAEDFRSALIPDILEQNFLFDLSDKINTHEELKEMDLRQTFDSMRTLRNQISHGKFAYDQDIGFPKVIEYVNFIRKFSLKIDIHLVTYFFILERF